VRFLGQIVDGSGIIPNREKAKVVLEMKQPTSITDIQQFLGMANKLSKFSPNLAENAKPHQDLLSKKITSSKLSKISSRSSAPAPY
jgi:hypothetical protein